MNNATPIIVAIVLVLIGIFFYVLFFSEPDTPIDVIPDQDENVLDPDGVEASVPAGWQTYTSPQDNFTFSYPPQASTSVQSGRTTVTYLGPDNTPGSEISDGFIFDVQTVDVDQEASLLQIAEEQLQSQLEDRGEITGTTTATTTPRRITVGNKIGYEYELESELGPMITYVVIQADETTAFVASYMVEDPGNRQYQQMIDTMLQTLQYEEATPQVQGVSQVRK